MSHEQYKVVWQKWVDPFGQDNEETSSIDYESETPLSFSELNSQDNTDGALQEEDDNSQEEQALYRKHIKVIASPMGLIPYNEHTASSKIFNFWLGHTNFDITTGVSTIIEETDGVETLDIFTRYRFRIAVGKCFGASETMVRIQENIYRYLDDQALNQLSEPI